MKYSEFRRWLERQGATFTPGRGSHWQVKLNGETTTFADHGAKELGKGMEHKMKKDLKLK